MGSAARDPQAEPQEPVSLRCVQRRPRLGTDLGPPPIHGRDGLSSKFVPYPRH